MKNKISSLTILFVSIFLFSNITYAQSDTVRKPVAFSFALGLISGNDYGSTLKDYLGSNDISGYLGWVNIEMGLDVRAARRLVLYPNIRCLGSSVKSVTTGFENYPSGNANLVILPGLTGKYYILERNRTGIFIAAGAAMSICSSDFDDFNYKSDGMAKEAGLGFEYAQRFKSKKDKIVKSNTIGFKAGYIWLPVSISTDNGETEQKDFGGFSFSLYGIF